MRPEPRPTVTFVQHEVDLQAVLRARDLLYVRLPSRQPPPTAARLAMTMSRASPPPPLQGRPLLRARLACLGARLDLVAIALGLAALVLLASREVVL